MDNIINFQDKKKKDGHLTPKEDMFLILEKMRERVEKEDFTGFLAICLGKDNKVYSVTTGEFDILLAIGGMETIKQHLIFSTSDDELD